MKLLILGIDGATFDLILPWVSEGHLPNLQKLMALGTRAQLQSTLPPVTSPAWPTFMTGCNPGKHGVFDFIRPQGSNFTLVNSTQIKQPTLWKRLSDLGYRVGVLNVPVTYPPQEINGFMVTDILSPKAATICHPETLIERYQPIVGRPYRIAPNVQYKSGTEIQYIEDLYDLIRAHGEWALTLAKEEPVDVLMVHFIALDLMMHALWKFMDDGHPRYSPSAFRHAIRGGHQMVDYYIGRLLDQCQPDHVVVMSDHGFGPLHKIVNLNNHLLERRFLTLKQDPVTQTKAKAFRWGLTPAKAYQLIEKLGLQNIATRVSKGARNQMLGKFLSFDSVDWSQTVAYSMGHVGQIYLNMEGREPHGIVSAEEYLTVRQEVANSLLQMRFTDGRPVVTNLIMREEVYQGPYAQYGPDIHLVLDDYNVIAYPLFATNGEILTEQIRGDSGCHRREGIFIMQGAGIRPQLVLDSADILDVAPTIMALLGEAVPTVMDGRVLREAWETPLEVRYGEPVTTHGVQSVGMSEEESAEITARLKSLGYL